MDRKRGGAMIGQAAISLNRPSGPQSVAALAAQGGAQSLAMRVEALEAAVRDLQQRAVMQSPDGRISLPADHVLRIEFGTTNLTMDFRTFRVEVNGVQVIDATAGGPSAGQPPGESAAQLAAPSRGSWQAQAQQSAYGDPRRLPDGTPI